MGLFDNLGGALSGVLGQVESAAMPALISAVLAKTNLGDLSGIVSQLQQGGLGAQVSSWLGNGANLPVTPDQLQEIHRRLDGLGYLPPFAGSKNLRDTEYGVRIEFLVTGDKELLALRHHQSTRIVTPAAMIEILRNEGSKQ